MAWLVMQSQQLASPEGDRCVRLSSIVAKLNFIRIRTHDFHHGTDLPTNEIFAGWSSIRATTVSNSIGLICVTGGLLLILQNNSSAGEYVRPCEQSNCSGRGLPVPADESEIDGVPLTKLVHGAFACLSVASRAE